jgi:hypothetical protein
MKRRLTPPALTTAALLSGQLDGLMAAWERTIETEGALVSSVDIHLPPTEPEAAIRTLERELAALEQEVTRLNRQADAESQQVLSWEVRAMLAEREARIELASVASRRVSEHRAAAAALALEAAATTEAADAFRNAISAIRLTQKTRRRKGFIAPAI